MHNKQSIKRPLSWEIGRLIKVFFKKMNLTKTHKQRIDILRKKGLKLGKNVMIHPEAWIDSHYCYLISIGDNSILCIGSKLLAHDGTLFPFTDGHARLGKIDIKENCVIGTNAVILPGVTIGPNVLVAPGSVVNKDIPPNSCVAGVPARYYSSFDDYINKHRETIKNSYIVDGRKVLLNKNGIDEELKNKIIEESEKGPVHIDHCKEIAKIREDFV